jgi:hypothetical protein
MAGALDRATEAHPAEIYAALRLQLVYQPVAQLVEVTHPADAAGE